MVMVAVLLAAPAAWAAWSKTAFIDDLQQLWADPNESASVSYTFDGDEAPDLRDRAAHVYFYGGGGIMQRRFGWTLRLGGDYSVKVRYNPPPYSSKYPAPETIYSILYKGQTLWSQSQAGVPPTHLLGSVERVSANSTNVRLGLGAWIGGTYTPKQTVEHQALVSDGALVGFSATIYGDAGSSAYLTYKDFYACSAPVVGKALDVGSSWETVDLPAQFEDDEENPIPVVVCSVNYDNNSVPVVPRVQIVDSDTFEVKLQNPSGGSVEEETVHYMVVEEGPWRLPDLRVLEGGTVAVTTANYSGSWSLSTSYSPQQTYHASEPPAVLGQVMTCNDDDWSVYWCNAYGADPGGIGVGYHVGEDTDTTRASETLGVIVVDAVSADGDRVFAAKGSESVQGIDDNPPDAYSHGASDPDYAIVSQVDKHDCDGSWAYLYGGSPWDSTYLYLAVDEDQIGDQERSHAAAPVAYVVFDSP